ADQCGDPRSLLAFMRRLMEVRAGCPELGLGQYTAIEVDDPAVFAHRCDWGDTTLLAIHNLSGEERQVSLDLPGSEPDTFQELLSDREYGGITGTALDFRIAGYGYRWLRQAGSRGRDAGAGAV